MTTQESYRATLPVPPGINRQYQSGYNSKTGRSRLYKSPSAKQWAETAELELARQGWRCQNPASSATIDCTACLSANRDIDNILKPLIDACAKALGQNDRIIRELHVTRYTVKAAQRVDVVLTLEYE